MKDWRRNNFDFVAVLLGMALFRTAIADWNPIPRGGHDEISHIANAVEIGQISGSTTVRLTSTAALNSQANDKADLSNQTPYGSTTQRSSSLVPISGR